MGGFSKEEVGKRRASVPGKEISAVQCGEQPRPASGCVHRACGDRTELTIWGHSSTQSDS